MKTYRIMTDGKWFKIQIQIGWWWKRWINWNEHKFSTMEEAEDKIRTLCHGPKWKVVKTFNTGLDNVLWSRPSQ